MLKQTQFSSLLVAMKRMVAITLTVVLCAVAIAAIAENTQAAGKHFTLEAATTEVSSDPNRPALTIKEIAKQLKPSIVGITTESTRTMEYGNDPFSQFGFGYGYNYGYGRRQAPQIRQSGAGSGIVVSADGYILTNSHVVNGADVIKITMADGTEYDGTLVGEDEINDMAVIKVDAKNLTPAIFGDSAKLEVGELAVAIGNPLGEVNGSVTAGIISATEREIDIDGQKMNLLLTDAAINPGNSGGALINSFGEVIGIVNAKAAAVTVEGMGYAIPINNVKTLVEDIINNGGSATKASNGMMLGVRIRNVGKELSAQYGIPEGVYVISVDPFSPAEKAGMQGGDTIVSLAGQKIADDKQLNEVKAGLEPGIPQEIIVLRDGKEVKLSVTLLGDQEPV